MMASNNYYGFTHGNTAYSSGYIGTPNVASGFSGHGVAQSYSTAPRAPATYEQGFSNNSVASNYGYTSRPQPGTVAYAPDANQYAGGNAANTMYPYTTSSSAYTNTYNSVVTNYAASALYNQQATVNQPDNSSAAVYTSGKPANWNMKKAIKGGKMKTTPKVQQLHYCEVCKISCAGPQTYKEHLEGQRHKKKEAQMKTGNTGVSNKRGQVIGVSLRCELCDVTCTGNDAYGAHIRGSKHQKVLKLHTKLGKPIPSTDPVVLNQKTSSTSNNNAKNTSAGSIPQIPAAAGKIKVLGTPKINFIGGGRLHTTTNTGENNENQSEDASMSPTMNQSQYNQQSSQFQSTTESQSMEIDKSDSQPVGQDYVEEVRSEDSKSVSFHCKLCDCRFNDPNAKEMHLKGRRHRLQYKKKVDPNLVVDIKPSLKHRKIQETKDRRYFHKQRDHYWTDWFPLGNRYGYDGRHMHPPPPPPPHMMPMPPSSFGGHGAPMMVHYRRGPHSGGSWDDNHILQKHSEICPSENALEEIHHVVMVTERALKLVSDKLAEEDSQASGNVVVKKESTEESNPASVKETQNSSNEKDKDESNNASQNADSEKAEDNQPNRILKGLMRIGPLAKNLLLVNDKEVDLVVICAEKPTKQILQRVVDHLPQQLQAVSSSETFDIQMKLNDGCLSVSSTNENRITVNVSFTSPLVRESNVPEGAPAEMVKEPKQMLDRQKCLNALAALRHAKWYQARVVNLHPCPMIIRLLRDLCRRLPTWSKMDLWAVELLCERVISSAGEQLTPGEAFRHVLEAIASGLILPGGSGLIDPCEKDPTDALSSLTRQEREDITSSAQHALRLIAFRQIHKILGVEPMQPRSRKRRHDSEAEESTDMEGDNDNKKDKRETSNWAEDEAINSTDGNGHKFVTEANETASQQ